MRSPLISSIYVTVGSLISALLVLSPANSAMARPSIDGACTIRQLRPGNDTLPVRLLIQGDDAHALGTGVVTVSHQDGRDPITVDCSKPHLLLHLRPGNYIASVDMAAGPTREVRFTVARAHKVKTIDLVVR